MPQAFINKGKGGGTRESPKGVRAKKRGVHVKFDKALKTRIDNERLTKNRGARISFARCHAKGGEEYEKKAKDKL